MSPVNSRPRKWHRIWFLDGLDTTDRIFIFCLLGLGVLWVCGFRTIGEVMGAALSILLGKKIIEFILYLSRRGRR
jgi:hypothetical protein